MAGLGPVGPPRRRGQARPRDRQQRGPGGNLPRHRPHDGDAARGGRPARPVQPHRAPVRRLRDDRAAGARAVARRPEPVALDRRRGGRVQGSVPDQAPHDGRQAPRVDGRGHHDAGLEPREPLRGAGEAGRGDPRRRGRGRHRAPDPVRARPERSARRGGDLGEGEPWARARATRPGQPAPQLEHDEAERDGARRVQPIPRGANVRGHGRLARHGAMAGRPGDRLGGAARATGVVRARPQSSRST
jgi:hypothetical protein